MINVKIHFSHYKTYREANWGKFKNLLVMVDDVREQGLDVTFPNWSIYDGQEFKGFPVLMMLRGKVIMEDGIILAEPGCGRNVIRNKEY